MTSANNPSGGQNTPSVLAAALSGPTAPLVPYEYSGQIRMGDRLAGSHKRKLMHVYGVGWHYWDGKRWAFDDRGKAYQAVKDVLKQAFAAALNLTGTDQKRLFADIKKCESDAGLRGVLSVAAKHPQLAFTVDDLNSDPYLLNVANGTIDLRTFDMHDHDPADRITKVCSAAYHPDENHGSNGLWQPALELWLPDPEVREYLQRVCGIALVGKQIEHVFPILHGKARNGKTVFYKTLLFAFGDYADAGDPDLLMSKRETAHLTGQMDLQGKRLVTMSEIEKGKQINAALMKRLTGADIAKARKMHKDFEIGWTPSHTLMMITNDLPSIDGEDTAVWERVSVIPFDVFIPKEDRDEHFDEKLQLEADAVLTWMIDGWKDYSDPENGGMRMPEVVRVRTNNYQMDNDDVSRFIAAECVTGGRAVGREATSSELHTQWVVWQMEDGCPPMGLHAFGRALDDRWHVQMPSTLGRRARQGIALVEVYEREKTD